MTNYQVTTPFGWVDGYPLNQDPSHPGQGFHKGIDYAYPMGTPVVVNGVTIGVSNNTGATTGPHLHVGKWLGAQVYDPGVGNGFSFQNATVTQVGEDVEDGKFVRIEGDGFSWVYLHLEQQLVNVGDVLKGDEMFEGKTAQEWAAIANDGERWKTVGEVFANRPEWEAMGGSTGEPNANLNQINIVMDGLEQNKIANFDAQPYKARFTTQPDWGGDMNAYDVVPKTKEEVPAPPEPPAPPVDSGHVMDVTPPPVKPLPQLDPMPIPRADPPAEPVVSEPFHQPTFGEQLSALWKALFG